MTPFSRKRFGQHFLEPAWVDKVIRVIDPKPDQTFVEIGPGRGALTLPLAARARAVMAFEIDRDLARELRDKAPANVTIVEGDFLDLSRITGLGLQDFTILKSEIPNPKPQIPNPKPQIPNPIRAAANLPYNVASPILFRLVDLFRAGVPLFDATVMLQREVADRLLAAPGTREYGVLSVLIRHRAEVVPLLNLPAGAFRPRPKVLSSVVRLRFHEGEPLVKDSELFVELVQAVFTRRRKMMANAILAFFGSRHLSQSRSSRRPPPRALPDWLDWTRRPETLTVTEFARLADDLSG